MDNDLINPDNYEDVANNVLLNEGNQILFYPNYKKLDSCDSIKSDDLYFHQNSSVSNHNLDNLSNYKEAESIDNYNDGFKRLLSVNNDEDELTSEKGYDNPNMTPSNLYGLNKSVNIVTDDDSVVVFLEEPKCQPKDKINDEKNKPIENKKIRGKRGPYKKKAKPITKTKTYDKCFPFSTGKGLLSDDANGNKLKQYINAIFRINVYQTDSNGNKKKEKKQRKFKPDDIIKKIKVRFHKKIKNIINENLKKAGSAELFSFLPQYFLSNISKKFNNQYMNTTYGELLSINFSEFQDEYANKTCDKNQYEKNKKTLEYLEKNPEISKMSGFDEVKKMKYRDIFRAYFASAEFEESIETLKEENENAEYIQEYFLLAKNYVEYFMNIEDNVY